MIIIGKSIPPNLIGGIFSNLLRGCSVDTHLNHHVMGWRNFPPNAFRGNFFRNFIGPCTKFYD